MVVCIDLVQCVSSLIFSRASACFVFVLLQLYCSGWGLCVLDIGCENLIVGRKEQSYTHTGMTE